jgi:hypothetical protein
MFLMLFMFLCYVMFIIIISRRCIHRQLYVMGHEAQRRMM